MHHIMHVVKGTLLWQNVKELNYPEPTQIYTCAPPSATLLLYMAEEAHCLCHVQGTSVFPGPTTRTLRCLGTHRFKDTAIDHNNDICHVSGL